MVLLRQDGAHSVLEHVARADGAHDDGGVDLRAGAFLPAARASRFDAGDTRIEFWVRRTVDLDEVGVASVVAHQDERARRLRVARDELGDAGGAVNVPDRRCLVVDLEGLLGAHF